MPVKIKKVPGGAYVMDTKGHKYSKKPLPVKTAKKQLIAINLSTLRKEGRIE
jgi:hypothetical protein